MPDDHTAKVKHCIACVYSDRQCRDCNILQGNGFHCPYRTNDCQKQMCCAVLHQEHLTTIVFLMLQSPYTSNKL